MQQFIGAIDQGTTSTRFMIFDRQGQACGSHQLEHRQILPRAGWVEHDPAEIIERTSTTIRETLRQTSISADQLGAIGITNQRETTVVWNPDNGECFYNAIVWQDTRTDAIIHRLEAAGAGTIIRERTGLPPSTYFSGGKIAWLLENVAGLRTAAERGKALFGTIDSWLLWNLTGGPRGGVHLTDVTNASRTMLMNLESGQWDQELLDLFGIPRKMMPAIRPSGSHFGTTSPASPLGRAVPVAGILGDQQAATVGQACFRPGTAKNTYGTGNFMLLNTGRQIIQSKSGLLTTPCYQFGEQATQFALEGSIAVTGSAVQWLRDQLGVIKSAAEIESLANTVEDNGGVYFVPAFSGLFAPYWRSDARGVIVGLSRFNTSAHLARATLEAICFQTRDVLEAMTADSGIKLDIVKVDGGATVNDTLMQLQADILGVPVVRPSITETTALGASYAAGLTTGFWAGEEELSQLWRPDRQWQPQWNEDQRQNAYAQWKKAVERTLDWSPPDEKES